MAGSKAAAADYDAEAPITMRWQLQKGRVLQKQKGLFDPCRQ